MNPVLIHTRSSFVLCESFTNKYSHSPVYHITVSVKQKITFSLAEIITPCGTYLMYCEYNFIQRSFKILMFPGFM